MKKLIFVLLQVIILNCPLKAQIPNPGFEFWTAGIPDDWLTSNQLGFPYPVFPSPEAFQGLTAARGEVVTNGAGVAIPILKSGSLGNPFPITSRPVSLSAYLISSPHPGDTFFISIVLYKNNSVIGSGVLKSSELYVQYTQITVGINYLTTEIPDEASILITINGLNGGNPLVGSYFIIDQLELSTVTDIEEKDLVSGYNLRQNYPNPFNPNTVIIYELPEESIVSLKIYDILGNEILQLEEGKKEAGIHHAEVDGSGIPAGIYFYNLIAGSYKETKKMVHLK